MLDNVPEGVARVRIIALDEQIKTHREAIKRLEAKRAKYKAAKTVKTDYEAVVPKTDDDTADASKPGTI